MGHVLYEIQPCSEMDCLHILLGTRTQVYTLSPSKQKELDAFLKENLESGRI